VAAGGQLLAGTAVVAAPAVSLVVAAYVGADDASGAAAVLDLTGLPDHDLILASGEAATKAVEHARVPTVPFIDVSTEVGEHRARIVIRDHGRWRTPTAGGDRGRGLQMIGRLADATLTVGSRGTTVVLCNRRGSAR
jgi:hypothetical protein